MVREDKVDILVELTGHTANNKLGMMACKPAPVQVSLIKQKKKKKLTFTAFIDPMTAGSLLFIFNRQVQHHVMLNVGI